MFDLVGIGNPVYDIIVTPAAKTEGRVLSGCSTNACLAARRLGMRRVGLIGNVGRDFAQRFRLDMKKYDVTVGLDEASMETGGFRLIYDESGNRTLDVLGVAGRIAASSIPKEFLETRFLLIGPILGEVDLELIEFIRSSTSAILFLDPQGLVRTIGPSQRIIHECDRNRFKKIVSQVDFVKPNELESLTITGETDSILALRHLQEMGSAIPIVTMAERGSLLLNGKELHRIPPFRTDAIDPTGAGDVYAGSFITEYDLTRDLSDAALFASAAASIMIEQVGPDFRMSREAVEERKETIRGRLAREVLDQ